MSIYGYSEQLHASHIQANQAHTVIWWLTVVICLLIIAGVYLFKSSQVAKEEGAREERELAKAREALVRRVESEEGDRIRQKVRASKAPLGPVGVPSVSALRVDDADVFPEPEVVAAVPAVTAPSRTLPTPISHFEEGNDVNKGIQPE